MLLDSTNSKYIYGLVDFRSCQNVKSRQNCTRLYALKGKERAGLPSSDEPSRKKKLTQTYERRSRLGR